MGHIKNLPAWANDYLYVVARKVDGDWWFYAAFNDFTEAGNCAWDNEGEVFTEWCGA